MVARAIFESKLPVVSAGGHETDFSISDFVADLRAPTPSAAAELISPNQESLKHTLLAIQNRLQRHTLHHLHGLSQRLDHLAHRLAQRHPGQRLSQHRKVLNQARHRLQLAGQRIVPQRRHRLDELLNYRLLPIAKRIVPERRRRFQDLARTLEALSPLPTLARGYAIVMDGTSGTTITSAKAVKPGSKLRTQLSDGQVISTVDDINDSTLDG